MNKEIADLRDRVEKLERAVFAERRVERNNNDDNPLAFDFSLNERAFIKRYGGGFNGQQFFALVTAYIARGRTGVSVSLQDIKAAWQRCSGMIGVPYASTFSTRAKENSWVDAARATKGSYVLGKHWLEIQERA